MNGNIESAGKLYRHAIQQHYNKHENKKQETCSSSNTCSTNEQQQTNVNNKKMIPDYIPPYSDKESKWLQEKESETIEVRKFSKIIPLLG